ncbi:MAG: hypothetical protein Q8L48_11905 [Archangium sp.]|nr:hypothetical protein [Archangium sp.]
MPVVEGDADAGVDAGQVVDAGVDAGVASDGGEECLTASDCGAAPWASRWCVFGTPAGLSCVAQRCVSECVADAGRTCTYDSPVECMRCGNEAPLCNADNCPTSAFSGTVSSVECRAGVTPPMSMGMTLSFVPIRGASCEMSVSSNVGGVGQVVRSNQDGRHYWFIRPLGGWCVGEQLPTGAIRSVVSCPDCTFGVEGF